MKKILQKLSFKVDDGFGAVVKNKFLNFINKHPEVFCLSLIGFACLFFLFLALGSYPLIDVDETRYAVMARNMVSSFNWNDLMLNSTPFLEKPPLYFWLVATSIKFFGHFSAWTVRIPIAVISTFLIYFTYFVGKKVISRKFGTISALILLSSVFFLILSHIAIIDMVLTVFMTSAIYCAFLTNFYSEKYKKYCWWYFYTFIGLGFLAKGILALAIPITVIFLYKLAIKDLKEMFKPINIVPGAILFVVLAAPWHILMYKHYGFEFIKQYFLIHHFGRLMGSEYIGRERPFLYFVPVFLLGFMPWTFIFLAFLYDGITKLVAKFIAIQGKFKEKLCGLFEASNNEQKLLLFSSIYFIIVFFVFSISSTKLPTYIFPVFPAAALMTGYYWWVSDERGEHKKSISIATQIIAFVFILAAMIASIGYYFLPWSLQSKISSFKEITIVAFYLLGMLLVLRLKTKRALSVFFAYMVVMFFIVTVSVIDVFNVVYKGGENEIVQYSKICASQGYPSQLVTFDFAVKPSVLIDYNNNTVNFITDSDFKALDKLLEYKNGPTFVIVKNKNFDDNNDYRNKLEKRLNLVERGDRYSLYVQRASDNPKKRY